MTPPSSPVFVVELTRRAVVRVAGPDARGFLQGLLTQDVEGLSADELRFSALLTPQGRFLFDLFLAQDAGGDILLDVEAARRDDLIRRLVLYRLRAKVEIAPDDARVFAAWGGRPQGEAWRADPRLAELGWRALSRAAVGATATEDAYDAWRLGHGAPDPVVDCAPDGGYPIEFDFDLLNGIDFHKGCFVGQETTSRMKRRGQIKTRTLPLDFDGPAPAPGSEILAGSLRAGEVLSGRDGRALALVRLDRIEGVELTVDGRPVRIGWPAWWPEDAGSVSV